jgi:hypothetical protein
MTPVVAVLIGLGLAGPADSTYCLNPPARASDEYWDYIKACGCDRLYVPPRASSEYERFTAACNAWRERNPQAPVPSPKADSASPPRDCRIPPSRASDAYWTYIESCGCGVLLAPSRASLDYDRYWKACNDFIELERRRMLGLPSPSPAASPQPIPSPTPSPSPAASPAP